MADISEDDGTHETQLEEQQPVTEQMVPANEDASAATEVPAEAKTPPLPAEKDSVKKKNYSKLFLAIVVVLALLAAGLIWYLGNKMANLAVDVVVDEAVTSPGTKQDIAQTTDPELARFITPTTGETWLATPKDMPAQDWLKSEQLSYYQDNSAGGQGPSAEQQLTDNMPVYKEVGSRAGNRIVLVSAPGLGQNGMYFLFEIHPDGKGYLIVNPQQPSLNEAEDLRFAKEYMTSNVAGYDQTIRYDSLNVPVEIDIDNGEKVIREGYLSIGLAIGSNDGSIHTVLVKTLGRSTLYRIEKTYADTGLTNIGYYIKTPFNTKISMWYEPNKQSLEGYTFTNSAPTQYKNYDGKIVYDDLSAIARGCGGAEAAVTRSDVLKDTGLTEIGKTNTGRAVYELKDKAAALYTKAYGEYKESRGSFETAVSFDEFVKNHGLVIIKNGNNERLVYTRGQYRAYGGCAKPVVYLYPTVTTTVSVRVGANVTVSDPLYPTTGWRGVVAQPSGALSYEGRSYASLFWEGQGYGEYPGIVSGTVVKQADAAKTIRRQLAEQNLNQKEVDDFMAFWESKIPRQPYVRLTWLNTTQMNQLAPLAVSPKPDTVIRVFLDMSGFDDAVKLPAQKLTKVERKGFTVVEWGGLTQGNLR